VKLPTLCWAAVVAAFLLLSPLATAQGDLYDNGPTDGYTLGWTINFGFAVSDQFTLRSDAAFNSFIFAAWLFPGDVLQTAELSVTSSEFGGTSYFDQRVNFTQGSCFSNGGFNVCNEFGVFGTVALPAGSYWLNLSNATVASGDPVYWDMNSGPSLASESSVGTIPSESFTITGDCSAGRNAPPCGPPPPTTPEPTSLLLFASGVLTLLAAGLRRFL